MASPLQVESEKLKSWLCHKALPFWAETAIDDNGGWYEHLDLDDSPNRDVIRRLRVQARQIYVYGLADKMGWYPGKDIVSQTFDFMVTHGFETDEKPGFIHLLTPDYKIENDRRDLYDHAFYLFSCGWTYHVTVDAKALDVAEDIIKLMDEWESPMGGWQEGTPATLPRRQNPHMHLLEAFMAWHDITGDPIWMKRANKIFYLFKTHFFDQKHHIIREFFQDDWTIADGAAGDSSEPGHLAEWIWLLWMYEKRSGADTSKYASALYTQLCKRPGSFLNDEEDIFGKPRRATKRLWVQTEVIKAHLAQANRGVPTAAGEAARTMNAFRRFYLNENGTWTDQINDHGDPIAKTVPTSTFYHIICMIYEALNCEA